MTTPSVVLVGSGQKVGRRHYYFAGDRVGTFTLVAKSGRGDCGSSSWKVRCDCGAIVDHSNVSVVRARNGSCRTCSGKARRLPRECRSCGTKDEKRFYNGASECGSCERRSLRLGRCVCGMALRSRRRVTFCPSCQSPPMTERARRRLVIRVEEPKTKKVPKKKARKIHRKAKRSERCSCGRHS